MDYNILIQKSTNHLRLLNQLVTSWLKQKTYISGSIKQFRWFGGTPTELKRVTINVGTEVVEQMLFWRKPDGSYAVDDKLRDGSGTGIALAEARPKARPLLGTES